MLSESQIENKMVKLIRDKGGLCFKFTSPGNPGVPDRIVIAPGGHTIFVELKTHIGSMQNIQKWQHDRMRRAGLDVRVLKGWDQVKEFVSEVYGQ